MRERPDAAHAHVLAATDPANPYGSIVRWPPAPKASSGSSAGGPTRSAGARVVLVDGALAAYLRRGERELLLFAPPDEPRRSQVTREVARAIRELVRTHGMLLAEIDGHDASAHAAADAFVQLGFARTAMGLQLRPLRQ
jgi:ATP-dependent Lhr-like helicase